VNVITLLLLLAALIFFVLAGIGVPARWNLIGFGLACWVAVQLIAAAQTFN
jgi:hypothetical protein